MFLSKFLKKGSLFSMEFKGFGLSLVDNEPKEIIYMSIHKLNFVIEKVKFLLKNVVNSGLNNTRVAKSQIKS